MFYSHEVLTSRKYGFATVWFVATMGSGNKKVSRKAILDVDVTKTCETIATPTVPLALRLQSSLLYGVTRVYAQQCGYVLHDVENARNQMRAVLKTVHNSRLNAEGVNKGSAEHLLLRDDPSFLPDFDLALADIALTFEDEQYTLLTATASMQTSNSRLASNGSGQLQFGDDLTLGSLHSPSPAVRLSDNLPDDTPRSHARNNGLAELPQYSGLQEDLGLMIGDDGDAIMQEFLHSEDRGRTMSTQPAAYVNDHLDVMDDGDLPMELAPPSPPRAVLNEAVDEAAAAPLSEDLTTLESAQAPLRPSKIKKVVQLDPNTEISRSLLKSQQDSYLANMLHDITHRQVMLSLTAARKNAMHWMFGDQDTEDDPMSLFTGMQLLSVTTKIDFGNNLKREHTPEPEITRRVRSREVSDEATPRLQDDVCMPDYDDIEQGREQPTPLNDLRESTLLPWNQSTGSRRPTPMHTSLGGRARLSSLRRHSRLGTASPLAARAMGSMGPTSDAYELQQAPDVQDEDHTPNPATQLDTQGTGSQWLRSALHDESMNFLDFVDDSIKQRNDRDDAAGLSVDFHDLLPTADHSYVVAAQAFLHVLVLGTKKLLTAEQTLPFGGITLRIL